MKGGRWLTGLVVVLLSKEWDEIVLVSEDSQYAAATKPIEDPDLKALLVSMFASITGEEANVAYNLSGVWFCLRDGDGQIRIQFGDHGQVAFPDWFGTRVFGMRDNLRPIVDALLKRPAYMPEAPFEERLWDTGLVYYQDGDADGYMASAHRMKLAAMAFSPAAKHRSRRRIPVRKRSVICCGFIPTGEPSSLRSARNWTTCSGWRTTARRPGARWMRSSSKISGIFSPPTDGAAGHGANRIAPP